MNVALILGMGNQFRSVIVELALRRYLETQGQGGSAVVISVGVVADPSAPLHPEVIKILAERGLNARRHRPLRLTHDLLRMTSKRVAMDRLTRDYAAINIYSRPCLFTALAGEPDAPDIPDVTGDSAAVSRDSLATVADRILASIPRVALMLGLQPPAHPVHPQRKPRK